MRAKVGVFDSGIGGLTVLDSCIKRVEADWYYYGDNANAPYGTRSREEILSLTRRAFDSFLSIGVSAAVVACNTVTTLCIDILRKEYPFPIVGTEPALSLAKGVSAVLATKATLTSERFFELKRRKQDAFLVSIVPDHWVEKVERSPFAPQIGKEECFFPWADTIVLGCTHFLYLKPLFGTQHVVDGNEGVARRLAFMLNAGKNPSVPRKRLKRAGMRNHLLFCLNNKIKRTNVRKKYPKITYFGSGKERNRRIYEQMFVLKRLNFR